MTATAPGLVPLLWGPGWGPTVPLLQLLAIAGIPQCLSVSVGWIYQARGRTGTMFRMGVWTSVVAVAGIVAGLHWGTTGVAWAVVAYMWILTPITLWVPCRMIDLHPVRVLLDALPTLLVAGAMGAAVWFLPDVLGIGRTGAGAVGLQVLLGAAVYLTGIRVAQPSVVAEARALLRRRN
jgi:O-antigen/teichoic acid export membrane protein